MLWISVFRSRQLIFVICEYQADFTPHAAIAAEQSGVHNALLNGFAKEAPDSKVISEDNLEDMVFQFASIGDITTPDLTYIPTYRASRYNGL